MLKLQFRKAKQKRRDRFAFAYHLLRYRQEPTPKISTKRFTPKDANPELLILLGDLKIGGFQKGENKSLKLDL